MIDLSDRNLNDSTLVQSAQNFINEVMAGSDADPLPSKSNKEEGLMPSDSEGEAAANGDGSSKIREDGLFLFRNLCKLSMKFSTQDNPEDPLLMRGKVLSLELLKIGIENAGSLWRANESYFYWVIMISLVYMFAKRLWIKDYQFLVSGSHSIG